MIYLDNAATSMDRPECVVKAVSAAMTSLGNVGRGVNEASLSAARVVFGAREKLTALFGGEDPERLCFTSNSTEALNTSIFGLLGGSDHVITTDLEHNSVLRPLYRLEQQGMGLSFLRTDRGGNPEYGDLRKLLQPNTKAVVCTQVSNLTGNATDVKQIGDFCRENGLLFILDASQGAGTLPIDVKRDHISVLCFTGHKGLMGPQGTGGLYVSPGVEIRPLKTGGTGVQSHLKEQPKHYPIRLESGTLNGHGIAGLSAAVDFIQKTGIDAIHRHEITLMRQFLQGVEDVPGVSVYGDFSSDRRGAIVSLNVRDMGSAEVADILMEDYEIVVRSGAHCAPRMHEALGTEEQGAVRFSFGWFNTEDDAAEAAEAIRSIAAQ